MPSVNIVSNYDNYIWGIYLCCHYMSSWNGHGQLYFTYTKWSLEFSERRDSAWYNVAGEPSSPLLLFTSLSSVLFSRSISLSEVNYFRALWNETLLQSCNVFYNCISGCIYLKKTHFRLVPRLIMSGALPPLSLEIFMACVGDNLRLLFVLK
jgi:hypothetical protein